MKRGIIAAPAKISGKGAEFRAEGGITSEDLRYFLLYWDRIVIPTTNLVHLAVPEEEGLLSTGHFTRPQVNFTGSFNGELIANAQLFAQTKTAKSLIEGDGDIHWTLHQIGEEIIIPDREAIEKRKIQVGIVNCLPVPAGNVNIADVMEFKERRKDELANLHDSIDSLYLEILASPDPNLKSKKAILEFKASIAEIETVSVESWKSTKKYDLSAELNLSGKDVATGATAGAAFDFFTSLHTIPIGVIVGTVASVVKIRAKSSATFEPAKEQRVLAYLANARKEGILPERCQ